MSKKETQEKAVQEKAGQEKAAQILEGNRLSKLPVIHKSVYNILPALLKEGADRFESEREKDVFLLGSLGIISGCMRNTQGVYDQRLVFPNIYAFVVAPPASGKGVMVYARMLGEAYHNRMLFSSKEALKAYEAYRKEMQAGNQPIAMEKPAEQVLFIPGNASAAAVIKHLKQGEGAGIICEAEADSLANSFSQDWGNFDDVVRNAFQHETISLTRKGEGEFVEIQQPRLSIAISGTPGQVRAMVPTAENGLFSRFLYYTFEAPVKWRDVSPRKDGVNHTEFFKEMSERMLAFVDFTHASPTEFTLSESQWKWLNRQFEEWLFKTYEAMGMEATSITKRLGLTTFRIAMILSVLRKYEAGNMVKQLVCDDTDFETAMTLAATFHEHANYMYSVLPKTETNAGDQKLRIFNDLLPDKFETKAALEVISKLGLKERSAYNYLSSLISLGLLAKVPSGGYEKLKL
ncbi:DUF3987 domain-containing protein [Pontibacter pudoricolor]|uniref:DUF3987 domain-containing protein n=1 Tax=Pontibacter pudoricolor TaxID=2694930 RepID=UPI0013919DB7|nr:DUF3987 domain-containing protein [Pontibacter pudoricolor]